MSELRIAMWSGPRNVSTALMRSFGSRPDTLVVDEPFYAAYLARTGLDHPLREAVLRSQPNDWRDVVTQLLAPLPAARPVQYQKHMTHHMLPELGRDWLRQVRSAFLIRDPVRVLASYVQKRAEITLEDIGVSQQHAIFQEVSCCSVPSRRIARTFRTRSSSTSRKARSCSASLRRVSLAGPRAVEPCA